MREPLTHEEIWAIVRRVQAGEDRGDIAARYGISRDTIGKCLRKYRLVGQRVGPALNGCRRATHEWMEDAACVDRSTRLPRRFWNRGTSKWVYFTEWHVDEQAKVCADCPVAAECRDYGRQFSDGSASWPRGTGPVFGALPPPKMSQLRKAS